MRKELIIKSTPSQGHGTWLLNLRVYNGYDDGVALPDVTVATFTRVGLGRGCGSLAMLGAVNYLKEVFGEAKLKIETDKEGLEILQAHGLVDKWQVLTE
jgi:hypothetical protein